MAKKNKTYSFKKGFDKIPVGQTRVFILKFIEAIGAQTVQTFYRKKIGWQNIPLPDYEAINELFAEYGIADVDDIWEVTEDND